MLNILTKSCRILNDTISTRLPIHLGLLELLLFELGRMFKEQFYLQTMYKAIFLLAYYGLFRIGELTLSAHVIKAVNINMGINKNKILIVLYTSKTHGHESHSQIIKIPEIETNHSNKHKTRHFCPFTTIRKYINIRGNYKCSSEQFFIFRDRMPVRAVHVRSTLKHMLNSLGLDTKVCNTTHNHFALEGVQI